MLPLIQASAFPHLIYRSQTREDGLCKRTRTKLYYKFHIETGSTRDPAWEEVDTDGLAPKLLAQANFLLLNPKVMNRDLEENDLVDGPVVFCPAKPWAGDEGAPNSKAAPCCAHCGAEADRSRGRDRHTPKVSLGWAWAAPSAGSRGALPGCAHGDVT